MRSTIAYVAAGGLAAGVAVHAQAPEVRVFKQERDGVPATHLSGAELASLGDPLFVLVLRDNPDVTSISAIETLLQPDSSKRQTFVVDENIANPERNQSRRTVLSFTGNNKGVVLDTNVMLSITFNSETFPDKPRFIEAWGWDNVRGRYNYYKMDRTGTPEQRPTWKFRGSSVDADLMSSLERAGTCLQCHINGAPVMKELPFPWNNWHSFKSPAQYLMQTAPVAERWPVAGDAHFATERFKGAEDLEVGGILPAITQFNTRRINNQFARSDGDGNVAIQNGKATVLTGRRLLRHLFETTEFNIGSSGQKSGLHPLRNLNMTGPQQNITIPPMFFLNSNLIVGGKPADFVGLGLSIGSLANTVIKPGEYKKLVLDAGLELAGKRPGDADFAWLTPEASHTDNSMVDRLVRRGILTPEFVAATLLVDLEQPVLSTARASLLHFIPDRFEFVPLAAGAIPEPGRHPDDLARSVISTLEASGPVAGSPEATFLAALKDPNPINLLKARIDAYDSKISTALSGGGRQEELARLMKILIARRLAILNDDMLGALDETGGDRLFPVPPNSQRDPRGSGGQVIGDE